MGYFTYCGREVRQITKLFKNTQPRIAFGTKSTISNIMKQHTEIEKYDILDNQIQDTESQHLIYDNNTIKNHKSVYTSYTNTHYTLQYQAQ
jgi:hypothetical protein